VTAGRRHVFARELSCMIEVDQRSYCIDPAGGIVALLGKKWTLPLIGVLGNRPEWRFNDLVGALSGVGSKVLTERLQQARRLGLVARDVFAEVPVRIEYRLTEQGGTLRRALVPLLDWASTQPAGTLHASPPGRRPSKPRN
jgi:DNA-binding HxlR family transcriptional regulator